jgi:hypothetical protein
VDFFKVVETVPKFNTKIVERGQMDTPNRKNMTDHFSGLVQALQLKVEELN